MARAAEVEATLDRLDAELDDSRAGLAHARAEPVTHGLFVVWTWALFARSLLAIGDADAALALADRIDAIPFPTIAAGAALRRHADRETDRIRAAVAAQVGLTGLPA